MSIGFNHWNPNYGSPPPVKRRNARRIEFFNSLERNVVYLTIIDIAKREGLTVRSVHLAIAKGRLKAARRQPGRSGVLIHPDEYHRWSDARKKEQTK